MSKPIRYFMAIYGDEYHRIAAYRVQDAKDRAEQLREQHSGKAITKFYEILPDQLTPFSTYDGVIDHGIWLEDERGDQFSRYATDGEDSVWLCHHCASIVEDDLDDHVCADAGDAEV